MERQLRMGGGIMSLEPRQNYGWGSIVKSVTKGVKSAVKGAASAVKDVAKSDIGKLALMYGATAGLGSLGAGKGFGSLLKLGTYAPSTVMSNLGASLFGSGALADYGTGSKGLLGTLGITPGFGIKEFAGKMGMAKAGLGLAGLTTFMSQQGMSEEEIEQVSRDPEALKVYLRQYYSALNPKAEPEDVEKFVQMNTAEYRADGGRIGYGMGSLVSNFVKENPEIFRAIPESKKVSPSSISGMGGILSKFVRNNPQIFMDLNSEEEENRDMVAMGGRMQYALGTPEQNAMQASEIMDLPLNENPAGVTELDLRDSGGFIPPVGVKERADDIPAMLSNNEFVFTADAVRGMGDGDVNKGAQRMYDMMKKLENGGRV